MQLVETLLGRHLSRCRYSKVEFMDPLPLPVLILITCKLSLHLFLEIESALVILRLWKRRQMVFYTVPVEYGPTGPP